MKVVLLGLFAVIFGTSIGAGTVFYRSHEKPTRFAIGGPQALTGEQTSEMAATGGSTGHAKVFVVNGETHNFGHMDVNARGKHKFVFRNDGVKPLTLKILRTSCKCTIGDISEEGIPEGKEGHVTLRWTPKVRQEQFESTAEIQTSDPDRPIVVLRVEGGITQSIVARPWDISFANISNGESITSFVNVFSLGFEEVEFRGVEFEDLSTAKFFDVQVEPYTREEAREIEEAALCGFRVAITVKKGLPQGFVSQTVRIITDIQEEGLEIPIRGNVVGDLKFRASGSFDTENQLLKLGSIEKGKGKQAKIYLLVRGEHRNDVEISVGPDDIEPNDVLRVEIGKPIVGTGSKSRIFPISITIPKDSRPISRFGPDFGKINIRTTHPVTKELPVYVQFIVEG